MVSKVLLAEFERLKEKVTNLKASLDETIEANKKKEAEYVESKNHKDNEIRLLSNQQDCLDQKLCLLEKEILNYELQLKDSLAEENKKEADFNEYTFELSKVREELSNFEKSYEKQSQKLKDELKAAKAQLKVQRISESQLEKNFCATLKSKQNEIEEKLKSQQKNFDARFSKLEEKYKFKMDPLIYALDCINADINSGEAELLQKSKEVEKLKKENKILEKQYEEDLEARLVVDSTLSAEALMKGLKYFKNRPRALTTDAILGVLIVRANLQWILDRLHSNSFFSRRLKSLLKECNDIVNLEQTEVYPMLRNIIWKDAAGDLRRGNFKTESYEYLLPKFNSCDSMDSYFMRGTPEDSDFCMNELINSECQVSEKCWFSETNTMNHSGYKTSHRLLYFIIATQLKCEKKNAKFLGTKMLKHNLCERMFWEAKALFEDPHSALTKDLFLEHIALCGLEGYEEFAQRVWRENLRMWQNYEGCFGHDVDFKLCQENVFQKVDGRSRVKRTDTTLNGCHTHVTAVALSSLAFFLRYTVAVI